MRVDDKRLLWDARTRILLACAAIPAIIETAYLHTIGDANDVTLLFALLATVGSLLMALLPRIGGWAIVALWAARCIVPAATPFSLLFCLLMAVTIMAYLDISMAVFAAVVAEAVTATRIWLYPWDSSVVAIVCATAAFLMVALWLGSMMGWRERQEIEARERAELLHRLADQELATQLHHSVANDLTTILLLARQLRSGANGGSQSTPGDADSNGALDANGCDTVALIERTATESLAKVRTLIAGLDGRDGGASPKASEIAADRDGIGDDRMQPIESACARLAQFIEPDASSAGPLTTISDDELRAIARSYDERLHANGLTGEILTTGETTYACTDERKAALLDILHEVVGNIMKYADPDAGYCVVVALAPGLATLSASNGIPRAVRNHGHVAGTSGGESGDHAVACGTDGVSAGVVRMDAPSDVAPSDFVLSSGTGLDRCRQTAEALGGEFTLSPNSSTWTVLLKLPLV
ncbi:hypothetical protein BLI708_01930 [Bifidobacterium imperatoris]|uniref:Signal transduction histidine kinase n=1 Tax=Bifidobacterium imperatoris TaxID=2020965 RepID=A0A2N5IR88_9BIFI|nr:hypothetical protein [Bifidobacterium imperatoris]PLS24474.1 Signal transduction histidine kinase [Bifidobacterium imperatoris]QSY58106.1 hypothetical protein BLI708_01930 [Bifidobacterium imperatoris]